MATHAIIGRREADGTVAHVWVSHDGGLGRVGLLLHRHYGTRESLDAILALGDLHALGAEPGRAHAAPPRAGGAPYRRWAAAHGHETTALHRDCRRPLVPRRVTPGPDAFRAAREGQEYAYLLDDGGWQVSAYGEPFEPLGQVLVAAGLAEAPDAAEQELSEADGEALGGLGP